MKRVYGKTMKELMREYVQDQTVHDKRLFRRADIRSWFQSNYPKIKRGTIDAHITLLTVNAPSRVHYNLRQDGSDDLFVQQADGALTLYDPRNPSVQPIYTSAPDQVQSGAPTPADDDGLSREFAYESDLKYFLSKNLRLLEDDLQLFEDDGVTGLEYDAGGRFIDILAVDATGNYVVIELKVSRGYDRVVGQLLRYMGWVQDNLCDEGQSVRGFIVAREISEDLRIACSRLKDVKLFEYKLSVTVTPV